MRYPASDDIISIHTSVISFLTNKLTVFLCPAIYMPLFFSVVWTFWSFPLVFSRVEVLIFFIKWRQAGCSKSRWGTGRISRRTRKSEYKDNCVRPRVIQINPGLLGSKSFHELLSPWVLNDDLSKYIWRYKKRWLRLLTHKFERISRTKHPEICE